MDIKKGINSSKSVRLVVISLFYTIIGFLLVKVTITSHFSSYFTFPIMSAGQRFS
jgi:hypothetical protein